MAFQGQGHGSHSQSQSQAFNPSDDLPKTVARTLNQGSSPMSMDFHPIQQTLLLGTLVNRILLIFTFFILKNTDLWFDKSGASVGTNVGDIGLWEVGSRDKLVLKNFKVWDLSACSMPFQVCLFLIN